MLIILHVGAGVFATVGMLVAWSTRKGGYYHRLAGRAFSAGMLVSLLVGMMIALRTGNVFLLLIGLFTGYLVYTGWRLSTIKNSQMTMLDKLLMFDMLIVGACMLGLGVWQLIAGSSMGVVMLVFGVFASAPAIQDFVRKGLWPSGQDRILLHVVRMGAASIASVTAILVVNVRTDPEFIAWLAPTVVFTPLISWYCSRVRGGAIEGSKKL